jgi:hypothetical protein
VKPEHRWRNGRHGPRAPPAGLLSADTEQRKDLPMAVVLSPHVTDVWNAEEDFQQAPTA